MASGTIRVQGGIENLFSGTPITINVATAFQSGGIIHLVKSGNLIRCYANYDGNRYSQSASSNAVIGQIPSGYRPVKTVYTDSIGRGLSNRIEGNAMFAFIGEDADSGHTFGDIEFNPNAGAEDWWFFDCIWATSE